MRFRGILGGASERHRIGATSLPAGSEQSRDGYAVGVYQHHAGPFTAQAALSIAGVRERADFGLPDREQRASRGLQLDSGYQAGSHRLGAGLLLTAVSARDGSATTRRRTSLGAYVQDQWSVTPELTVDAGLRADRLGRGSIARVEPRAAIVWQSGNGISMHAGYSRFVSAAPIEETGRAGLPIEQDDYFAAGIQRKTGPWTFGLETYVRSARNLIAARQQIGSAAARAFAFARGRFRGVELSATYARGPINGWANLSLSRSRARSIAVGRDLFSQAELDGAATWVPLASDRPVTASGGLTWHRGKLSLSGDMLAGSGAVRTADPGQPNGWRAPAFATFGLAAVYHLRIAGHPDDLRLDLTNLADVRYPTSDARNLEGGWARFAQGRAMVVGIEQAF